MMQHRYLSAIGLICIFLQVTLTHAQDETTPLPPRFREMNENELILINVAAKGRVVELLANELARTEIIRALLVEYAKECVTNVTTLEKHCLNCMMERCQNRMSECEIDSPPLSEVINHNPSKIQGLQFLSLSPRDVEKHMLEFTKRARTDILQGIPESLRKESETIMHSEVDQSLKDLDENFNTEKALKTISIHVQKAANNVNQLPDLGEKVGTIIIENEDHAVNIAELLARKLKESRPFLESINHNGARVMEQMPSVLDEVKEKVSVFKEKISGVFSNVLNTFQNVMNKPDTEVTNGNWQTGGRAFVSNFNPNAQRNPNMNMDPRLQAIPGMSQVRQRPVGIPNNNRFGFPRARQTMQMPPSVQSQFQGQDQFGQPPPVPINGLPFQGQTGQPVPGQQFQNGQPMLGQQFQNGQANQQIPMNQNLIPQGVQNQQLPIQQGAANQQLPVPTGQVQVMQGQQIPQFQGQPPQGQFVPQLSQNGGLPQNQPQFQGQINGNQIPQGQTQQMSNVIQPVNINQPPQQPIPTQGQAQLLNQVQQVQPFPQNPNNIPNNQGQFQPSQSPTFQGQSIQGQSNQIQMGSQGRKKRHTDPDCGRLKTDPDTSCRTYETHCHNCTLEKKLRFEVCGEGVEKARDEIKRLDQSVSNYLKSYDDHIAGSPLVLKVELNDRNRLHKTNSYYDAFVTAKIGPSIFRYKSKMILNAKDIRTSGSQIGDELWEKLWENNVFEEARKVVISSLEQNHMGQKHNTEIHFAHAHSQKSGSALSSWTSLSVGLLSSLLVYLI